MDLSNAILGEQYYIYIDKDNKISSVKTYVVLCSTVIGIKSCSILLGWKAIEHRPADANLRTGTPGTHWSYVSNQSEYIAYAVVSSKLIVDYKATESKIKSVVASVSSGCTCKLCGQFSSYAIPNQLDGKFICYGCKIDW